MDGNGRWAESRNLNRREGHIRGAEAVLKTIIASNMRGIKYLTLYAFSTENFKRSSSEVSSILEIISSYLLLRILPLATENHYKIVFLGDLSLLPQDVAQVCTHIQNETAQNTSMHVCIAIGYGGRSEVVCAINSYIATLEEENKFEPISYEKLASLLYTSNLPDPDLVIRYGGHKRLSNFMPLQTVYSDFIFTDKLWPDFVESDLDEFLSEFAEIQKNYGGAIKN
jgi:undecaprenyl diphosphate synthase